MSKYKVTETEIRELLIIEPTNGDKHDSFVEADLKQDLIDIDIDVEFVQDSSIKMRRGELSGLHFQREQTQDRLVHVVSGSALAVAVDLRPNSYTYGASCSIELSDENQRLFWLPKQFALGLLSLESNTVVISKCTDYDNLASLAGVIWSDPILSINWQFERYDIDEKYLRVSDRDKKFPSFRKWDPSTLWGE